ncbi:MAG: Permease of the drug/metabolite transporter (DMT) superfamily, partial [uncultured Corynebacteriales bacterium]
DTAGRAARSLVGPARGRRLLLLRPADQDRGRRPPAAVHRLRPGRRGGGPGRAGAGRDPAAAAERDAVGAARGGRRRGRGRVPAAHLVRAHQRPGQPRRRGHRRPAGRHGGAGRPARARAAAPGLLDRRRCRRGVGAGVRVGAGGRPGPAAPGRPAAVRGRARRRRRLRRGRAGRPRARRLADRVLGAGRLRAADGGPDRPGRRPAHPGRHADAVGGLRLPRRGEHVPGLLRLVPRTGDRAHGAGQPGPAGPARPDDRLGRAPARRAPRRGDRRGRTRRHPLRRDRRPGPPAGPGARTPGPAV